MAYHTTAYLIVFLPVTACIYQLAWRDKRRYVLLLAGYYFFWTFSKMLLLFLIGTTLFTHYICIWMTRIHEQNLHFAIRESEKPHRKTRNNTEEKKILIFGILVLLGVLGYLKYHNFFVSNWNFLADRIGFIPSMQEKNMLIPIGISSYDKPRPQIYRVWAYPFVTAGPDCPEINGDFCPRIAEDSACRRLSTASSTML